MAYHRRDWWHTDEQGRRIGWLTPEDFASILEEFYGKRLWMKAFAREFGFTYSTTLRYKDGEFPIPKHVARIVQMLAVMRLHKLPMSDLDAPWLDADVTDPGGTRAAAAAEDADPLTMKGSISNPLLDDPQASRSNSV